MKKRTQKHPTNEKLLIAMAGICVFIAFVTAASQFVGENDVETLLVKVLVFPAVAILALSLLNLPIPIRFSTVGIVMVMLALLVFLVWLLPVVH